jgi:hypothetical protein
MSERFDKAQDFIWRNARILERHLFACLFTEGSKQPVLAALRAHQNVDGGFGHGLEPDKRCPYSQPVDVEFAFKILDQVDGFNDAMVLQACGFLETITTEEGGVPISLPTAIKYPHTPWWEVPEDPPADLNPTASLVGLLLKHGVCHTWMERAVDFCRLGISATDTVRYHDVMPIVTFLEHAPERAWADREMERLLERLNGSDSVTYATLASGYYKMPLDWAPSPSSPIRRLFSDELLQAHLQALAERQQPDGGWAINWEPIALGVEMEWRGSITVEAVCILRAYGYPL